MIGLGSLIQETVIPCGYGVTMTIHRSPHGQGGESDPTGSDEDLSSREETIEPAAAHDNRAQAPHHWPHRAPHPAPHRTGSDRSPDSPSSPDREAATTDIGADAAGGDQVGDAAWMSDADLEHHVVETARRLNAMEAELAMAVAELDRRGVADRRHVLSTKQWLRHACRMSADRAATVLRIGRSLEAMPTTTTLARTGAITPDALRSLAGARSDHPVEFAHHEAVLADAATYLGPRDLRRAIDHWRQQVAFPTVLAEIEETKRRRRLSCNRTWDGMWSISGTLDPESGHIVDTALRARTGSAHLDPEDRRTTVQRAADALVDLCRFALDHDTSIETSGGSKPHITATVDVRTLTAGNDESPDDEAAPVDNLAIPRPPLPDLDGQYISPEDARRLACDAGIARIITDGPSHVLDVGRGTRTIPAATRRAVEHRDGECAWTGCDAHTSWCDVHHIVHWAHGGSTDLDNLMLLCRRHHTAIHEGRSPPP